MSDVALLAVALLVVVSAIRRPPAARKPEQIVPALATCVDCGRSVPIITRGGTCGICGSSSIVLAWSYSAKLIIREQQSDDRKRFLRAGTAERRRV